MADAERAKRLIAGVYSWAADTLYEPLVVNGAFEVFGGRMKQMVRQQGLDAAAGARGRPILDMPVGTGTFTLTVAGASEGLVVGSDIAGGMVRQTSVAARRAGFDNLAPVQADAHRLPFRDGSFAAALCTNGLQVMPGLAQTLGELRRVLADDGVLYVSVVNVPVSSAVSGPTLFMSRPQLRRSLDDAGFDVVSMKRERLATLIEARRL